MNRPHTSAGHDPAHPSARRRVVSCGVEPPQGTTAAPNVEATTARRVLRSALPRRGVVFCGVIAAALLAPLAAIAPQASGATRTAATASPSAFCPELTGTFNRTYYGFNETGGTISNATSGLASDRLTVTENATNPSVNTHVVTLGAGAARAADHGLMTTAANNLDPGTKDFFVCIGARYWYDVTGSNLAQWSPSNNVCPAGSPSGQIKIAPWYVQVQGTAGCAKPFTGIVGLELNENRETRGWHTFGLVRHGDYVGAYFDHVSNQTVHQNVGSVDPPASSGRMSLLGKYVPNGDYPYPSYVDDMCDCSVAWVEFGVAP